MMHLKTSALRAAAVFAGAALILGSSTAAHAGEAPASKVFVRWSAFTPRVLSSSTSTATRLVAAKARLQGQLQGVVPGSWVGRSFEHVGWSVIAIPANQKATALKKLQSAFGAANVEAVHRRHLYKTPNDPDYTSGAQWWLDKIGAPAAWDKTTGDSSVVVAVIDSGAALPHPDLAANIWKNAGEIAGNGKDDDGNGYVDDVNGFNALAPGRPPEDDSFHGTHVSGIIGAVGNNSRQVSGVNWNVKIIPVKAFNAADESDDPTIIQGLDYILALKAKGVNVRTINHSWGGTDTSQVLEDAFAKLDRAGILSVVAAGNDGNNIDPGALPDFPAAYTFPTILSVGGSDSGDAPTNSSNFGARNVDIFAPGEDILSLVGRGNTAYLDGTSMATPMVTGAAALLLSLKPTYTAAQLKTAILSTAYKVPALNGKCVTGGRLDLGAAIASVSPTTPTPPPTATPKPTPTATPKPTATPRPTPTSTPIAAPRLTGFMVYQREGELSRDPRYTGIRASSLVWANFNSKVVTPLGPWGLQFARNPHISPDGSAIVFTAYTNDASGFDIFYWKLWSPRPINLTAGKFGAQARDEDASWLNATTLLFKRSGQIYTMALDAQGNSTSIGAIPIATQGGGGERSGPVSTLDGNFVLYWKNTEAAADLYRVPRRGGAEVAIAAATGLSEYYPVTWKPAFVLYSRWQSASQRFDQVYSLNLSNGATASLPFNALGAENSDATPIDARYVLFSSTRRGSAQYDLYIGDSQTGQVWTMAQLGLNLANNLRELGADYYSAPSTLRSTQSGTNSGGSS